MYSIDTTDMVSSTTNINMLSSSVHSSIGDTSITSTDNDVGNEDNAIRLKSAKIAFVYFFVAGIFSQLCIF